MLGFTALKMAGLPYYGPTFSRKTTQAVFGVQVTNIVGALPTSISIGVEHRNADDTGWTTAGTFTAITADGYAMKDISGLKELLRYTVTVTATNAYEGAHIITLAPQWIVD